MYIQNEIDQGIEVLDRAPIAHFGPFDPERLSLTVDAFTCGALVVDGLIEGTLAIQQARISPPFSQLGSLTQPLPLANWAWSQVWPVGAG